MIHIKTTIIQPIEINTQTLIKLFDIKINIENFKKYENIKKILEENSNFYYYKAIKYLDATRDKAEIEYLKNFLNINKI